MTLYNFNILYIILYAFHFQLGLDIFRSIFIFLAARSTLLIFKSVQVQLR